VFVFTRQPAGPACRATAPASSGRGGSGSDGGDSGTTSVQAHERADTAGAQHAAKRRAQQQLQFAGNGTAASKQQRVSPADAARAAAAALEGGGRQGAEPQIPAASPGPSTSSGGTTASHQTPEAAPCRSMAPAEAAAGANQELQTEAALHASGVQVAHAATAPVAAAVAAAAVQPTGPGLRPAAEPGLRSKLGADSEVELFADTMALLLVGRLVGGQAGRQVAGAGQMPAENAGCCQPLWSCVVMLCLQAPGSPVGPAAAYNFLERFMLPGRKGSVGLPVWGNRASLPVVWHNCDSRRAPCLSVCLPSLACLQMATQRACRCPSSASISS
jgi:hypothetical protein